MVIAVVSSAISAVDYRNGYLQVTFESGHLYCYYKVPRRIFTGLLRAASKGRYFHEHILHRFRFKRLR